MRALLILVLLAAGCGASMSKEEAIAKASEVADLSTWKIVWVDAPDLGGGPVVNLPGSYGATFASERTIYVVSAHPSVLIHEAVHVALGGDGGHCEWAKLWVPYFETEGVWGGFDDDCLNVHCSSNSSGHQYTCKEEAP